MHHHSVHTVHFQDVTTTPTPVCFHDVSYDRMKEFFDRAHELLQTKHKYSLKNTSASHSHSNKRLPRILIKPPSKQDLKRTNTRNATQLDVTQIDIDDISEELKNAILAQQKDKQHALVQKYEEKLGSLKSKMTELYSHIHTLESEVSLYKQKKHPHLQKHLSIDDLELEIQALEHKLIHYSKREKKYTVLAHRIKHAREVLAKLQA